MRVTAADPSLFLKRHAWGRLLEDSSRIFSHLIWRKTIEAARQANKLIFKGKTVFVKGFPWICP